MTQKYMPLWEDTWDNEDLPFNNQVRFTKLGSDFIVHFLGYFNSEMLKRTHSTDWATCKATPGALEVYRQLIIDTWEESEKTGQFEWRSRLPFYIQNAQIVLSTFNDWENNGNKKCFPHLPEAQAAYVEYINWLKQQGE